MAEIKLTDEQLKTVAGGDITISYGGASHTYTSSSTIQSILSDFPELGNKWPSLKNHASKSITWACEMYCTDEAGFQQMIMQTLSS